MKTKNPPGNSVYGEGSLCFERISIVKVQKIVSVLIVSGIVTLSKKLFLSIV